MYHGPHFQNFPKTFSKDLPMSALGIAKKFSCPNFQRLSLHFQKKFFFYLCKLVQPIRHAYTDHDTKQKKTQNHNDLSN